MNWKEYFMMMAFVTAMKSKDTATQVGAIITGMDRSILGTGFNGAPIGVDDTQVPNTRPEKYPYMLHAEANAVLFSQRASGTYPALAVCTLHPCHECTKLLIQIGIEEIVYFSDIKSTGWEASREASKHMCKLANVNLIEYDGGTEKLAHIIPLVHGNYMEALTERTLK